MGRRRCGNESRRQTPTENSAKSSVRRRWSPAANSAKLHADLRCHISCGEVAGNDTGARGKLVSSVNPCVLCGEPLLCLNDFDAAQAGRADADALSLTVHFG